MISAQLTHNNSNAHTIFLKHSLTHSSAKVLIMLQHHLNMMYQNWEVNHWPTKCRNCVSRSFDDLRHNSIASIEPFIDACSWGLFLCLYTSEWMNLYEMLFKFCNRPSTSHNSDIKYCLLLFVALYYRCSLFRLVTANEKSFIVVTN